MEHGKHMMQPKEMPVKSMGKDMLIKEKEMKMKAIKRVLKKKK